MYALLYFQCNHLELPNLLLGVLLFESGYHGALDLAGGIFFSGRQLPGDILRADITNIELTCNI